jgi:cytochrome P450
MPTSMLSSNILRYNDEKGMSREKIIMLAGQLIMAGSETTTTTLSGAIFQLLQRPAGMKKLTEEIRIFTGPEDMSFTKLANLNLP